MADNLPKPELSSAIRIINNYVANLEQCWQIGMSDTPAITSEIFVAYSQCPRKAYLLLFCEDKGKLHDYPLILEERRQNNRSQYLDKFLECHPEARVYDTKAFKKYEFLVDATLRSEQLEAYCAVLTKADTRSANRQTSYEPTIVTGTYRIHLRSFA